MTFTLFGVIQGVIGLWLVLRGSINQMFAFLLISALFGGTASLQLAFGSSITPVQFALLFVCLRIFMPGGGYAGAVPAAVKLNLPYVLFTFYGIVMAYAGPRLFAGQINVAPLRAVELRSLFDAFPLRPTPQNITASLSMLGGLLIACVASIACRFKGGAHTLVKTGVAIAWIHGLTGVIGAVTRGTPVDLVFDLFRNAHYAQLDQAYQGFVRINGVLPEASTFASFGLAWLIFNCECWYRSIMPRATGRAAIFLIVVLFFSTSSTAYIGLAFYGLVFFLRFLLLPGSADSRVLGEAVLAIIAAITLAAVAMVAIPQLPAAVWDMILHMTVDKEDSDSGRQRLFWAMQGWHAFVVSGGLGIGPGSFRSSSLLMAILGSTGVIGVVAFLAYLWKVVKPARQSTWAPVEDPALAIGGAAAFTALMILVPASISAPSPDPGTNFAIFAGSALGLRATAALASRRQKRHSADEAPPMGPLGRRV